MWQYLSAVAADYTTTTLSVTPQVIMDEDGNKRQIVHEADDGTVTVVSLSADTVFDVSLQWDTITPANATAIMDFYHDAAKANGQERTFYWEHPLDGCTYTVRFMCKLDRIYSTKQPGFRRIKKVTFRVVGTKP